MTAQSTIEIIKEPNARTYLRGVILAILLGRMAFYRATINGNQLLADFPYSG